MFQMGGQIVDTVFLKAEIWFLQHGWRLEDRTYKCVWSEASTGLAKLWRNMQHYTAGSVI
jgi:hypothetical protein